MIINSTPSKVVCESRDLARHALAILSDLSVAEIIVLNSLLLLMFRPLVFALVVNFTCVFLAHTFTGQTYVSRSYHEF